jgi:Fe-S-cluster containining protein
MGVCQEQNELMIREVGLEQDGLLPHHQDRASLQQDFERGLRFSHVMMSINQHEGREGVIFAHALSEVLVDKGIVTKQELETMMAEVSQQLAELPTLKVMLAKSEDKYTSQHAVSINCASRIHLCKARCCTFAFYLTEQDLDEGIVRWDYGRSYWVQRRADGYCVYFQPGSMNCRIHANRPYDWREDERVWIDFEEMIPAGVQGREVTRRTGWSNRHIIHQRAAEERARMAGRVGSGKYGA